MIEQIKSLDWKEITRNTSFWICLAVIALAISSSLSSCFESFSKTEEAKYKYLTEKSKQD